MVAVPNYVLAGLSKAFILLGIVGGVTIIYQLFYIIYNIFFHPLRNFPGPLLQRASAIPYALQVIKGKQPFETQKLHDIYGPVVRITPNHLSFTDFNAWKDIYGHLVGHKSGQPEMTKAYHFAKVLDDVPYSIINAERDEHARLRRALAHGFSDSSLRQQEHIITRHIDLLLRRLHEECNDGNTPLNAEAWYNWTTFDITGDLIFGQTFGCLRDTSYHPWIEFLFATFTWSASVSMLSYFGFHWLVQVIFRRTGDLAIKKMAAENRAMVERRLAMKEGREDLFEGLVKRKDEWGLDVEKLSSNAFILVIAGSETTATTLAGVTYLLLTHPDVLDRLKKEVRSAFGSREEMNISSVNKLSYMLAVLNEALRMYPPVTSNLVRQVPKGGAQIAGRWVAGSAMVEVQHWSINHSKENWADPWEFKPDRFLNHDGNEGSHDRLEALQAFSAGPRNCIGRNLAYAEMRLILARIIYDFDLKLAEDSRNWINRQRAYTLWDRIPLNVYFTPVQKR